MTAREKKLTARVKRLEFCLRRIRDYRPTEVAYDMFAYKRMCESYRDAARVALRRLPELTR